MICETSRWAAALCRVRSAAALVTLAAASLTCLGGCPKSKPAAVPTTSTSTPTATEVDEQCALIIANVHDTFHLHHLELTTTLADSVARLNDWQRACGGESSGESDLPADIAGMLSSEQAEYLRIPQFTLRDGVHLQDGVMIRAITAALAAGQAPGSTDLDRVRQIFRYVALGIELTPDLPSELALSAYEVCQLGKGTAADRAWVFASLLKQQRIDAVILSPGGKSADGSDVAPYLLVGVPVENQVYLFDPRLGVPIPAPPGSSGPAVATLEQAASDPAILRQLDVPEQPYPVTATDLERPSVAIATESGFWPERMRSLQGQFSGDQAMVISDPLQDSGEVPGLVSRVVSAGGSRWSRESVTLWDYPERQLHRHMALSEPQQKARAILFMPFFAYLTIAPDPKTGQLTFAAQEELADPSATKFDPGVVMRKRTTVRAQLRARLHQLAGDSRQAVMDYHDVWQHSKRVLELGPPADVRIMHARAMDDSMYWTALCKFNQGEYQVAIDSCLNYRRKYSLGAWRRQVRYLLALSHAATGNAEAAIKELSEADSKDPEYPAYQLLIRQWKSAPEGDHSKSTSSR